MNIDKIKQIQSILEVDSNGDFGRLSLEALSEASLGDYKKIQLILGFKGDEVDGIFGPLSKRALGNIIYSSKSAKNVGLASSFADEADIRAFKRCKSTGLSDKQCFKVGDNGIGFWGDSTVSNTPMCALPPDDWTFLGKNARGAKVAVTIKGKTVICELRDRMPAKKNVTNEAIIDLAPGAQKAFGLKAPFMVPCSWSWA